MTIKDVKDSVKRIEEVKMDDERAHSMEDNLHQTVLKAVAEGASNADKLAKEALKSLKIDFKRWCA